MFENLSERLSGVFDRLTKQGALSGTLSPKRTTNTSADKDCPCAGLDYRAMRQANNPVPLQK